jgi:hypothetical protein
MKELSLATDHFEMNTVAELTFGGFDHLTLG